MTAIVDGDIVAFRAAASAENEPPEIALLRCDKTMMDILEMQDNHITFLTGKDNFRYTINPDYKANRKDKPKPRWLQTCREFLQEEYKAIVVNGYEADDALGIHQTDDSVIYSIDKDLLMIPGSHFNFVKQEYSEVSELDGLKAFYKQMLIGDSSDNIFGVPKIGKVKAAKFIDPLQTELEMFELVQHLYEESGDTSMDRFWMNSDCLWIWRKEGETFSKRYANQQKES